MYSLSELIKTGKKLFHSQDLALLWGITRPATLHMRVKRYLDKGVLFSVRKGLYAVVPLEKLDPREVAVAINHGYCYLTLQSVLEKFGVINQPVEGLIFAGQKSRTMNWLGNKFVFRKLADKYLFNSTGIIKSGDFFEANLERAVADMLYFNPKFYFDSPNLINWHKVKEVQKEVGYE